MWPWPHLQMTLAVGGTLNTNTTTKYNGYFNLLCTFFQFCFFLIVSNGYKVRKNAKIRNLYNQVPHLTQDTTWESDKNTRKHHTQESQGVSSFPAGGNKAAMNRQECLTDTLHVYTQMVKKSQVCKFLKLSI